MLSDIGIEVFLKEIHIRVHRKNKRQTLTLIEEIESVCDLVIVTKNLRKALNCSATLRGDVIELMEDHSKKVK